MALNGKIAVVTGAAGRIGKAITEILLQNGAKVTLLDVNVSAGKSLKEALDKHYGRERTLFLSCNVESEEQIEAAFQKTIETFGGIDILCNNAGILNESEWEKTVSINLGVIRVTYLALQHMNKSTGGRGGVIVNTASMAGYGVRFNILCPGFIQTELFSTIFDKLGQFSHLADATQKYADQGVLNVSEVAECLFELVTDELKNGEALMVKPGIKKYMTFPTFTQ